VAQIYAEHSRVHQFTRIRDSREDYGILDEELFPLIDKAITERSADKNFYVVHLMGGHGLYYNRYPYAFTKFTKDDINLDKAENQKEAIAQYDNALYYNDYIVSSIIDKFRDKETLVIYVPDHGEAVYDEGGVAGHIEENPSRHMIEIPVIMWASDKFKVKYPEKWAAIKAAADQPYMTDDMIYTVMDLADIKTAEFDPEKSIVNTRFNPSRPRIFNGLNYDTQIRVDNIPMEK
jgi:heptose-I-phosphate ethanolaminephosphotransferase